MNNRRQLARPRVSDEEIGRLAARQHGIVTRKQLLELGLDANGIEYRLRIGRLIRLHRGVYAVGHRPPSMPARAMAAVLACGRGAALSHRAAGALWEMEPRWPATMEVTVPGNRLPRGIRVHRTATLTPQDITTHFGIPVTSPARTALDLADLLDDKSLARAVNEARLNGWLRLEDLAALLDRSAGRATTRLRPFVEHADGPTRSTFEDAFLAFVERHGLPRPEVNQQVAGHEVDMLWREQRLVVELDSRAHHDGDRPFERDRERDADLLAAGFPVMRVTWRRLTHEPEREADRLAVLLAAQPAREPGHGAYAASEQAWFAPAGSAFVATAASP
jgi:very-short-patch-repair endonuclease/predicted transcriptional regulator of viral defense system